MLILLLFECDLCLWVFYYFPDQNCAPSQSKVARVSWKVYCYVVEDWLGLFSIGIRCRLGRQLWLPQRMLAARLLGGGKKACFCLNGKLC